MNHILALLVTATLFGCSVDRSGLSPNDAGVMPPRFDAGTDASADAGEDAGEDTGIDAGEDGGVDTGVEDAGCIEGTSDCSEDTATVCVGGVLQEQSCGGLGCIDDHCARINPSNGVEFGAPGTEDWVIADAPAVVVNTADVCTTIERGLCIRRVRSFAVRRGTVLRVRGPHPLVVVADREISIEGTVDLTASAGRAGPGGSESSASAGASGPIPHSGRGGVASSSTGRTGGGGGGALCGSGGTGGNGGLSAGGAPGTAVVETWTLEPLRGGGAGGAGQGSGSAFGIGGGGGGAIQLTSATSIYIDAPVVAGGGAGGGGIIGAPANGSGGGGGAGGAVLLEAPIVTFGPNITIAASGGGGGGGAAGVSGGAGNGSPGQDGANRFTALGGATSGTGGAGGNSGAPTSQSGQAGAPASDNAGGGGGGSGCILVRSTVAPTVPDSRLSPSTSPGYRVLPPRLE